MKFKAKIVGHLRIALLSFNTRAIYFVFQTI